MKKFGLVYLALVALCAVVSASPASAAEESPFTEAQRVGEATRRYFHVFSTSTGKYTIRFDGVAEVYVRGRKKLFHLKGSARDRIERVYFYEYGGDLLLLYRTGTSGYLLRLDQMTRKIKRMEVINRDFVPPLVHEKSVVFRDGTSVPLS
ncbi:MAG TPA: hypothetical protein VK893_15430 [Pyrinomonadaceae bacterium]|nr:hypothetical protein [Pyrinomonadaceae bacterium]